MNCKHKKHLKNFLSKETGMTLVELLASILLLSLIVTTFLSFFIQAAKTNKQTDSVNEATFIAQEQIELLTHYSKTKTVEEAVSLIKTENTINGFRVISTLSKRSEDSLYKGTVKISKGEKTYAQMETLLSFETAKENEDSSKR